MKSSESVAKLADALVKANLLITNPTKDQIAKVKMKTGGEFSYRYVGLDTILADIRPILQTHGLVVAQEASNGGVTTRILHASGEWLEFDALNLPAAGDAQAIGSAITYARRYALCAALGIAADEDDDGNKSKASGPVEAHIGKGARTVGATARTTGPGSSAPVGHGGTERQPAGQQGASQGEGSATAASSAPHLKPSPHSPDMQAVKLGSPLTRCAFPGCPVAGKEIA